MQGEASPVNVELYIYDLSQGLARQLSAALLGKQIDGVWHTSVVVAGREWYYGGGVQEAVAGASPFGTPAEVVRLGQTEVPDDLRRAFIDELRPKYSHDTYDLFNNNCNNFSNELSEFLTGNSIPAHITGLPHEVLATPFGQMLAPMLSRSIANTLGNVQQTSVAQPAAPGAPAASHTALPQLPQRQAASQPQTLPTAQVQGVAEAIKSATAVATADTGIPMDAGSTLSQHAPAVGADHSRVAGDSVSQLAEAHQALSADPHKATMLAQAGNNPPADASHAAQQAPATLSRTTPSGSGQLPSSNTPGLSPVQRMQFENRVKSEFAAIMAAGGMSPNHAAAEAVRKAASIQQA